MKTIFYIFIFISVIMISSCVSHVSNPIDTSKYANSTYKAKLITIQKRILTVKIDANGGFGISFEDANGTPILTDSYLIDATNITGADPYYGFNNGTAIGNLTFLGSDKLTLRFKKLVPDYEIIGETLCIKQP